MNGLVAQAPSRQRLFVVVDEPGVARRTDVTEWNVEDAEDGGLVV